MSDSKTSVKIKIKTKAPTLQSALNKLAQMKATAQTGANDDGTI